MWVNGNIVYIADNSGQPVDGHMWTIHPLEVVKVAQSTRTLSPALQISSLAIIALAIKIGYFNMVYLAPRKLIEVLSFNKPV